MEPFGKRLTAFTTGFLVLAGTVVGATAIAQEEDVFAQYREMFGDDNPAELVDIQGEELWFEPGGPNQKSLETCDLGLGPGVVEGAYAQLPRYFADTDQVMTAESRLVHCMVTIQGKDGDRLVAQASSAQGQEASAIEALSVYVAGQSSDKIIHVPQDHPRERAAFELGQALFFYRAGPYDFSCATCHSQPGKRIRLQSLPDLTDTNAARTVFSGWPAYRISKGSVRTMEWRVADCARQQRLPKMQFGSQAAAALITYMGVQAKGGAMAAPGLKR